jgi:hypothetical protein
VDDAWDSTFQQSDALEEEEIAVIKKHSKIYNFGYEMRKIEA